MSTTPHVPARLASEDVIISAPMSYVGSARRISRLRRRATTEQSLVAITALVVVLIVAVWVLVTVWYLTWGLLLVPYRVLRRGARKRQVEMLRHRELLGALQGAAPSAPALPVEPPSPTERVGDSDREQAIDILRHHMLAGRLAASEFEMRVESVHQATTRGHLNSALADLPADPPAVPAGD